MKKATVLAALAATALVASPAMAGSMKQSSAKHMHQSKKKMHHAKIKHSHMHSHRHAMAIQQQRGWDNEWDHGWGSDGWDNGWDRRAANSWNRGTHTGFGPLDFATGVTAGAVGTAGAIAGGAVDTAGRIATAPFRDDWRRDSYAYYNQPAYRQRSATVSRINGPTCEPGAWVTINGTRMRCQ